MRRGCRVDRLNRVCYDKYWGDTPGQEGGVERRRPLGHDGVWLLPSFVQVCTKAVVRVTDHEMLTLVLMIIALVVSLLDKRDR